MHLSFRSDFQNRIFNPLNFHILSQLKNHTRTSPQPKTQDYFGNKFDLIGLNTFVVSIFYQASHLSINQAADTFQFANVGVMTSEDEANHSWNIVENPSYTLLLDGHLYLDDVSTIDLKTNLERLLHRISISTIDEGLHHIGGGMFNLFIIDKQRKRMLITTDRLGCMPLFYFEDEDGYHFSGNQFAFRNVCKVLDAIAVEFLKYGYLPFTASLFENVERLLPGQILQLDLEKPRLRKSSPNVFEFKPLNHRIKDVDTVCEALNQALERYFARFSEGKYFIGMNDELASLLLTGLASRLNPTLIAPHHSSKRTKDHVEKIAKHLKLQLETPNLSYEVVWEFLQQLSRRFRVMTSFECLEPVLTLSHFNATGQDIFLDGFMGETVFGNIEPDRTLKGLISIFKKSNQKESVNTAIREVKFYQNWLYHQPQAISDHVLGKMLTPDIESWFLNSARSILEMSGLAGHVHEDFIESLHTYTEQRCFNANRPVALSAYTHCACPFIDYEIMQICYETDKSLQMNDILYKHFWEAYFPGLSKLNRIKLHDRLLSRRRMSRFNNDFKKRNRQLYDQLISEALSNPNEKIPSLISSTIDELNQNGKLNSRLLLRYAFLNCYLQQ